MTEGTAGLGLTPTPDTGERLTEVRVWDEATRPTGPAPPPGTVYSRRGRVIGAHLIEIHDHLRDELTRVRDLVRQVREGAIDPGGARSAINEMTMRQNDWALGAYCAYYCRFVTGHHMLEDEAVFPHLRASEAGLEPVIDRLADEHKIIHQVLNDVNQALVDHLRNPPISPASSRRWTSSPTRCSPTSPTRSPSWSSRSRGTASTTASSDRPT